MTLTDAEQRLLDQQSGAEMDRRAAGHMNSRTHTTIEQVGRAMVLTIHCATAGHAERAIAVMAEDLAAGKQLRVLLPNASVEADDAG